MQSIQSKQTPHGGMRSVPHGGTLLLLIWLAMAGQALGQAPTVDTSVPALPGGSGSMLGPPPGGGTSLLGSSPGAGGGTLSNSPVSAGILGGRPGPQAPKGIPTAVTTPGGGQGPTDLQQPIAPPPSQAISPTTVPFYGTLDLTAAEQEEPPDGITLDAAIELALRRNIELRAKFHEIPMARADILQANLRANPVFYQDGQLLQYKGEPFSRARPGGPQQFDTNITYPLDLSHKRQARTQVAARAERVLEAQYQEAIRQRIDDIYDAFVRALATRQTVWYARKSVKGLRDLTVRSERLFKGGQLTRIEYIRVKNQLRTSELSLLDAEAADRKARLDLGTLMNLSVEESTGIKISGRIRVDAPDPPPLDELRNLALAERPDVTSFRLGIQRANADVRLARANAFSDVYVLWQPYTFQDNSPYGVKSATSWALGVTVPLPIYNRNQGGIERAKINVHQTHLELADAERQAQVDVAEALQEFETTRRQVRELEDEIIPEATLARDEAFKLMTQGAQSILDYINAQLEFNQIVKQYLDTRIRYRRSMLSINTVVGKRIMP
jgi:cobalt-zinc-cadmium efflux system outer membrane protein